MAKETAFERDFRDLHRKAPGPSAPVPTFAHGLWTLSVWIPALFIMGVIALVGLAGFFVAFLGFQAMWDTLTAP